MIPPGLHFVYYSSVNIKGNGNTKKLDTNWLFSKVKKMDKSHDSSTPAMLSDIKSL